MKKLLLYILLLIPSLVWSQSERKLIREGVKSYMNADYNEAEVDFRKAEELAKEDFIARYNTSAALYQQQKLEESGQRFTELLAESEDPVQQAGILHNLGNVFLESQQYEQAIDAYKRSLRINPSDEDTRYNLAYALEKLQEQQQQQQEQNQDQEQQQNQDQQEQNQDQEQQQNQDQEQKDQEQEQEGQQSDESKQEQEEQEKQQTQKQELSKEEAERLLNAILQKEKDVKEKVDKKKAAAAKVKSDKDW